MKFRAKTANWKKIPVDTLIIFVSEEGWEKELTELDRLIPGPLVSYLKDDHFQAKEGRVYVFPTASKLPAKTVTLAGVGNKNEINLNLIRKTIAKTIKRLKSLHRKTIAIDLTAPILDGFHSATLAKVIVEGVALGAYTFNKYKTPEEEPTEIEQVLLLVSPARLQHVANGIKEGEIYAEATIFARDLVNEAPTVTTPSYLADVAKKLKRSGIGVEVLDEKEVRKLGMNAFLAVSRGSEEAPKFIKLTYKAGRKKVVICGKAITFDTGGLSLKDAKNMETMKLDMSGAASVLGIFSALPKLKPKVTVVGLIAACENMPGPKASKPGDIVKALNGKTIEILNTDAEGRLTLADVLSYGKGEKPDYLLDLATLTGACMVALGEEVAGLFTNNKELGDKVKQAATTQGEKVWELPLEKDYKELVKSEIADLRNIGKNRYGGAITAALFLEEFVGKVPWVHLDMAGPAFAEKDTPLVAKGGSGFGVRLLLEFLRNL